MAIRPKSIVPIIGEPDIDESYIRQQDDVVLKTLLIGRTLTALNGGATVNIKWAVTGKWIEPRSRIGLLDRKLRIVTEQCKRKGPEEWLKWAEVALQGCYGFEWQGDNVLLARENMLYAVIEYYCDVFKGRKFPPAAARRFAEIISWNIWQMDGIKFVVPNTCRGKKVETPNLDGTVEVLVKPCEGCDKGDVKKHDGVRCRVMDWEIGKPVFFMPPFEFKPIDG